MDMTLDPVAFFEAHAARHLVGGARADPWSAAGAVFNDAYAHAMPMAEYAQKSVAQARRAGAADARRILASLGAYRIVDAVLDGAVCDVTEAERSLLVRARAEQRRRAPPRVRPLARRPGAGSVVLARATRAPFTIANVRWGSARVEQRWMHEDSLAALDCAPRRRTPRGAVHPRRRGTCPVLPVAARVQHARALGRVPPRAHRARGHRAPAAARAVLRCAET